MENFRKRLTAYKNDENGATFLEFMIVIPLIFFWLAAGFVFFDVFSASIQSKRSTYTITDSLSRQSEVGADFLNRMHSVFQAMVNQGGENSGMRISVIENIGSHKTVVWSVAEGRFDDVLYNGDIVEGPSDAKINAYVPILDVGGQMVMVETYRKYKPLFDWVGISERNLESVAVAYVRNSPKLGHTDIPGTSEGASDTGDGVTGSLGTN